jgi:hypothetical protein
MNSPRRIPIAYFRLLIAFVAFGFALALLIRAASYSTTAQGARVASLQSDDKTLSIERYPNEPVELVDIRIRERSVKDKVKTKLKDARNRPVLDHVSFKESNDWFKNVKIRVRNVSDRSICGLDVDLYFKPAGIQMVFKMDLKPRSARSLFKNPLSPGEEIDLEISEDSMNQALQHMFRSGVDVSQSKAYLSVHTVYFSEDFAWGQGSFMRRDPYNPNNWRWSTRLDHHHHLALLRHH